MIPNQHPLYLKPANQALNILKFYDQSSSLHNHNRQFVKAQMLTIPKTESPKSKYLAYNNNLERIKDLNISQQLTARKNQFWEASRIPNRI